MRTVSKQHHFRSLSKLLTTGDKILIVSLVLFGVLAIFFINAKQLPGEVCTIEVSEKIAHHSNLSEDQIISVTGPNGETQIQIKDKKISVIHSPCPEKICIRSGWIYKTGQIIVCVPNKVVIKIDGVNNDFFNVITQ